MTYPTHLIPTTVVGSYPQPDWLVDRGLLEHHGVPRVHAGDIWRVPEPWREQAQDDATIVAIREMELAGIDIVSDGEIRRESYSNRFALALDGIDAEHPGHVGRSGGGTTAVPRVVGRIKRRDPVEQRDAAFLLAHATHATKITLPGPFTLSQQAENAFYADEEEMAMDYAAAVNEELRGLKATGVDVVQLDEPWVRTAPEKAARWGLAAINRALDGIPGPTIVHLCFGYAAMVRNKPSGYAFLPQLADSAADADLDRGGAAASRSRRSQRAVWKNRRSRCPRPQRSDRRNGRNRRFAAARRAAPHRGRAAGRRPRLRHEVPAARGRVRQIACARRGRRDRPPRTDGRIGARLVFRAGEQGGGRPTIRAPTRARKAL